MQTSLKDSAFNSLQDRICLQNSLGGGGGGGSKPILSHSSIITNKRKTHLFYKIIHFSKQFSADNEQIYCENIT